MSVSTILFIWALVRYRPKFVPYSNTDVVASVRSAIISLGDKPCSSFVAITGGDRSEPVTVTPVVFLLWLRIVNNLNYKVIVDSWSLDISDNASGPWKKTLAIPTKMNIYHAEHSVTDGNARAINAMFESLRGNNAGKTGWPDGAYILAATDAAGCLAKVTALDVPLMEDGLKEGLEAHAIIGGWGAFNPTSANRPKMIPPGAHYRGFYRMTVNTAAGPYISYGEFKAPGKDETPTYAGMAYLKLLSGLPFDLSSHELKYAGP